MADYPKLDALDLTDKQRAFVEKYAELGGARNAGPDAAIAAGYSERSARSIATGLLRIPKVREALRILTEARLQAGVFAAAETLMDLMEGSGGVPPSVRLAAAKEMLDRGGMMLVRASEHKVTVEDNRTSDAILQNVKRLADKLGVTIDGLVIDAEYEEVSDEPVREPNGRISRATGNPPGRPWGKRKLVPGRIQDARKEAEKAELKNWLDLEAVADGDED